MSRLPRMLCITLAVLLAAVGGGCQSASGKKSALPPASPFPPAIPAPVAPVPPPVPPPGWPQTHQSSYSPASSEVEKLAQGMELAWHITSQQQKPIPVMSGKSLIGPDGTIVLGPYGQFHVTGMSLTEANQMIEERLRQFIINPKLQMQVTSQNYSPAGMTGFLGGKGSGNGLMQVSNTMTWSSEGTTPTSPTYTPPDWGHAPAAITPPPQTSPPPPPQKRRGPILGWLFGQGS